MGHISGLGFLPSSGSTSALGRRIRGKVLKIHNFPKCQFTFWKICYIFMKNFFLVYKICFLLFPSEAVSTLVFFTTISIWTNFLVQFTADFCPNFEKLGFSCGHVKEKSCWTRIRMDDKPVHPQKMKMD